MERIVFLLESSGDRIPCLLNPASLVVRRSSGVRQRTINAGPGTATNLSDDPLLYTGGGYTEILLELLFDVSLVTAPEPVDDVQDLTRPLMRLTEARSLEHDPGKPPLVRLIWGKAWNVLGVVSATAERLEQFTSMGAPQRSWLSMRLIRVPDNTDATTEQSGTPLISGPDLESAASPQEMNFHEVRGGGRDASDDSDPPEGERLDEVAAAEYGDPGLWRVIASFNNIDDPWSVSPGQVLTLPPTGARGANA